MKHETNEKFLIWFIRWNVFVNILIQIMDVFRAADIFNTAYIGNILHALTVVIIVIWFLGHYNQHNCKLDILDALLLIIPVLACFYGALWNGIGRTWISDIFNSLGFWVVLFCYKNNAVSVEKDTWYEIANIEMIGVLFSLLIYALFPVLGYPIFTVGKTSNFMLLPLAIYLSYRDLRWVLCFLVILICNKRGVILAGLVLIVIYFFLSNAITLKKKIFVFVMAMIFTIGLLWFTLSPEHIAYMPEFTRDFLYRFMNINPFSPYRNFSSDGRIDEVISSWKSIQENPLRVIMGNGNGFCYEYFFEGEVFEEARHNVHFAPVSLLTRYGIIYTLVYYLYVFRCILFGIKNFSKIDNSEDIQIITLYVIGTLFDSFTVFLLYTDYHCILCLGMLARMAFKRKKVTCN